MNVPRATYRLQFRNGMDFDRAAALAPYLRDLGVSHLYASPIFTATSGSTHGYDVTNQNEIDPALGGRDGFDRLSAALKREGLGLLLDIVPNHMAASPENPWWRNVLRWGLASPYRDHFDIDWRERLTLPVLGKSYDGALASGELGFAADVVRGDLVLTYFEARLPLAPASYGVLLEGLGSEVAARIAALGTMATPEDAEALHRGVRSALSDPQRAGELQEALSARSADRDLVDRIHRMQAWELHLWTDALQHLSYRRFFEVTGLVGVRVEREAVFEDVHRLTLELVRSGQVDGLRVDHVDGLADPKFYLDRLRQAVGPDLYIVVEKILADGEDLRHDWPVAGTTGYEFIAAVADAEVDADRASELDESYHQAIGREPGLQAEMHAAKTLILTRNFEGELERLVRLAAGFDSSGVHSPESLRGALTALVVSFPVYRTYGADQGLPEPDRNLLDSIIANAENSIDGAGAAALAFVASLLRGEGPGLDLQQTWPFRRRFQQLTGPVMAKAIEDTLFYRYNRLIALNEVGGDPDQSGRSIDRFHVRMDRHRQTQPHGMLATSTHDTKRGEDARTRLYAISEAPGEWASAVARWRDMNAAHVRSRKAGPSPGPDTEWLIYQALAGAWPQGLEPSDAAQLAALRDRFLPYLEKATREAKRRTDWIDPDERHEDAVKDYAAALLDPGNRPFLDDFVGTLQPFIKAGEINSLTQTLIKITAPGVPDIYQGSEQWDLSLVDPDNRRLVDAEGLAARLATDQAVLTKQRLIQSCLLYRRDHPDLFMEGDYRPLYAAGGASTHLVGFVRRYRDKFLIALATRLPLSMLDDSGSIDALRWNGAIVELPGDLAGRPLRNVLDGGVLRRGSSIAVAEAFARNPVALLVSADPC